MDMDRRALLGGVMGVAGATQAQAAPNLVQPEAAGRPLVIAHRGASGDRPEHTLSAYRLAIALGADFIEPDVVISKDGVLICRHENEISETTDVASREGFAARRRTKTIDGETVTGWFAEDFTLAELKSLRCKERLPQLRVENTAFDGRESIPTLEEVIDLAVSESTRLGRSIGVYPETKHPSYHRRIGLDLEAPLVALLKRKGLDRADAPVFIQSFEVDNLVALRRQTSAPIVQLLADSGGPFDQRGKAAGLTYRSMQSDDGLKRIAEYAQGVGPQKTLVMPLLPDGRAGAPTDLVRRAKAVGLRLHPWTFRAENFFLPADLRRGEDPRQHGDALTELQRFAQLGVDGWFTDHPALAAVARAALHA